MTRKSPSFRNDTLIGRRLRARASIVALAASGVLVCSQAHAQRVAAGTLPSGPASMPIVSGAIRGPEVVSGNFGAYSVNGNVATIKQNDPAGILRWATFDIGQGAKVVFDQPSSSAVVLNKVDGGAFENKTVIEGMLQANGQVYIYNPNGVIIGRTGQIDVNSFLASTLNIDNSRFLRGLLTPYDGTAQLVLDPAFRNNPGAVLVEGSIIARDGGRIILAAPSVTNDGSLVAEGGQVILAAGRQVFLASSADDNMRGLLVEVRNTNDAISAEGSNTSTATNTSAGQIKVGEGNATMVGYAVNQQGLISATTTVELNGSIWLLARDGGSMNTSDASMPVSASRGGQLTLGEGSRTEVVLAEKTQTDSSGTVSNITLADSDRTLDKVSRVLLSGETIHLEQNSSIGAKAGQVDINAQSNPGNYDIQRAAPTHDASATTALVILDAGSSIDVSGASGTQLAMESLSMAVELRGSQLADSPLLRYGPLRGQTVYVDVRKGTSIANIAGDLALREYTLGELAGRGGSVNLFADGQATVAEGAAINVSGGWVDYQSGRVASSKLIQPNGALVDIGAASKDVQYTGIVNTPVVGKRGIEAGYREGFSAGSVSVDASAVVLAGDLTGNVVRGPTQRDPSATDWPAGASLLIGDTYKAFNQVTGSPNLPNAGDLAGSLANYGYLGDLTLGKKGRDGDAADKLNIDPEVLAASGFTHFKLAVAGDVVTAKNLSLPVAGSIELASGGTVSVSHNIAASGGALSMAADTITLAPGVSVDLSGHWVNDLPAGKSASGGRRDAAGRLIDLIDIAGGDISLRGLSHVTIGEGATLDVSGGAQLTEAGKLVAGEAGSINVGVTGAIVGESTGLNLQEGVQFRGFGLTNGGSLKLQARDVYIGGSSPFAGGAQVSGASHLYDLWLTEDMFRSGGFAAYEIVADGNATIRSGAAIAPLQANWNLGRDYRTQASGSMAFAGTTVLPLAGALGNRSATSLTIKAAEESLSNAGRVVMEAGASIGADPGAAILLSAGRQLTVDGSIDAPGGSISLELSKSSVGSADAYFGDRSIWVGSDARLTARGSIDRILVDGRGVASGDVLDGGSISIGGPDGQSAIGHVVVADGAVLDVSGVSGTYTLENDVRTPVTVSSAGGTIAVRARESLYFNGTAKAFAGGASALGGSFIMSLDRESTDTPPSGYPTADLDLAILTAAQALPAGATANGDLTLLAGKGQVLASMIQAGGFDTVALSSQHLLTLDFASGNLLSLAPRASLTLNAPVIRTSGSSGDVTANFVSDYISLGNSNPLYQNAHTAVSGTGTLNLSGTVVDLVGDLALQGFSSTRIQAAEAVRLVGVGSELASSGDATQPTTVNLTGALRASGQLEIDAAAVYPTTLSQYLIDVAASSGEESSIAIRGTGASASQPYSVGGKAEFKADNILQAGTVWAPFGELVFSANKSLTFESGSLTSVSASMAIPFGRILNGREWIYDFGGNHYMTIALNGDTENGVLALPDKQVVAEGAAVTFKSGATIDLSAGGDLYGTEFLPGPGGSTNVLANNGSTFAILPSYQSAYAPVDPQNSVGSGLKVGDRVYLAGGNGLAAGYYTLLPAAYALLPGGYAITVVTGSQDAQTGNSVLNPDGSIVMAGRATTGATGLGTARWSSFLLTSGTQVRTETEFGEYRASTFFADAAASAGTTASRLPGDAGLLVFDVSDNLVLKGTALLTSDSGKAGQVYIAAPEIQIVVDENATGGAGVIKLSVADLQRLDVGSLLLGGRRDASGAVTVKANAVTLANDAGHALSAPDITLVAKDRVTVNADAAIIGTGKTSAETLTLSGSGSDADGALLRVTGQGLGQVIRTSPAGSKGTLEIGLGALVKGEGGVNLDATRETILGQTPTIGEGGGFAFGAGKISLGDAVPTGTSGVVFDHAALLDLSSLGSLTLTSYGGFDFYGQVKLGSAEMTQLTLNGAGIQSNGGDATLMARTVSLANAGRNTLTSSGGATPSGTLTIQASDIVFGSGLTAAADATEQSLSHDFDVRGFAQLALVASSEVRGEGKGVGALRALTGDLTITAPRVTVAGGADAKIEATAGELSTVQSGTSSAVLPIGGSLTLAGQTISHAGTAIAASGKVRLAAVDDLELRSGSVTSAAGQTISLGTETVYTDAGTVALSSETAAVSVRSGAAIDVSGHEYGGSLIVSSPSTSSALSAGRFVLESGAILRGGGAVSEASFQLDAHTISDFGTLNSALNAAGFGESRVFRARTGDVTLAAGESVKAQRIAISADDGDITLAGTLDARGESGGSIKVYAAEATAGDGKGNIVLASTAQLLASASAVATTSAGNAGDGGTVELGTSTADGSMLGDTSSGAMLTVQSGALIDVAGAGVGDGGRVILRVPRVGYDEGQDVAIAGSLSGLVVGAKDAQIEAFKVYETDTINATLTATSGTWYTETQTFINDNKANILANLGATDFRLQPGLEIRSSADMLVSVNETRPATSAADRGWNLNTWRFDGEPITLTLRATDQLEVKGSISDGFVRPTSNRTSLPDWAIDASGSYSASYRLVAGADFSAANPLAVIARDDESADFKLSFARTSGTSTDQPVALIRTGTGNIEIASGHDVVLGSVTTSQGEVLAGQIYTGGRPTTTASGYVVPRAVLNGKYLGTTATTYANAVFTVDGGNVDIFANHDVQGVATSQLFSDWLYRQGQTKLDSSGKTVWAGSGSSVYATSWWVQFDRFNQNLGTFGGGNIVVKAATGDVANLSASSASTAYVAGSPGAAVTEQGGGDVIVTAGGDIKGGAYYAQKGDVTLAAAGAITRGDRLLDYTNPLDGEVISMSTLPIIGLGDGQARIIATGDTGIETTVNPTLMPQSQDNAASPSKNSSYSYFGTYSETSSVDLVSIAGNATLGNSINALKLVNRIDPEIPRNPNNLDSSLFLFYTYYPGTVKATAIGGDIDVLAGFSMAPAATGQLALLAKGSVKVNTAQLGDDQTAIVMVDRDPSLMPSTSAPAGNETLPAEEIANALNGEVKGLAYHTSGGLHTGDDVTVKVMADTGDIIGQADIAYTLVSAKAVDIQAGGNVTNFGTYMQHLSTDDVSTIKAGGSITAPTEVDGSSPVAFRIGGPGRLQMLAGEDIDFGNSQGLVSAGNSDNPYLSAVADYGTNTTYSDLRYGADLMLAAGMTQGLKAETFLSSATADSLPRQLTLAARAAVIAAQGDRLFHLADGSVAADPTAEQIWDRFWTLPAVTRQGFYIAQASNINDAFFSAVITQVQAEPKNLAAFDAMIASYITPGSGTGDVNVFGSQIKTLRRGNIDIFTPNGSLYAGVVSTPASLLAAKTPADLGIFTVSGGEIRILVGQDISVNQGRIFTLGGGDISFISQYQDIDAGRGAKTAASAPPPTLEFDAFGNARVDISSSVSGSGIRTLKTGADVPRSSVYAASPRGTFDAGDAGVGSSGDVVLVAAVVLNANNISANGAVSGAPAISTSAVGSSVTASPVQSARSEDIAKSVFGGKELAKAFTFLTVDVLGFGDGGESAPPSDGRKNKDRK